MDILGIGGWELVAILLIMLVVAGPKRMIAWSYTAGKYVAMMRRMWAETARQIQKEFDDAGVDIQVPKDLPTRANITNEINRAMRPVTKPIQEALDETKTEIEGVKKSVDIRPTALSSTTKPAENPKAPAATPQPPAPKETPAAITPPNTAPTASENGAQDFGTWSNKE